MNKVLAFIHLGRPINLATGLFSVFAGIAILDQLHKPFTFLLLSLVVVSYNAAANAINDYFDYEIDRINRPTRPLSRGSISLNDAKYFSFILFALGSVASFWLPMESRLIAIFLSMPLMVLYSWKLKQTPLFGNLVIAFILGLAFIFIGSAHDMMGPMIIPAMLAFGLTFIREIVKDMADIKGDRAGGAKTFPERMGMKNTAYLTLVLSLSFGIMLLIPYFLGVYSNKYLLAAIIGVSIPLWLGSIILVLRPEDNTASTFSKVLKLSTILGVLAVYLG